ncbi:unnamed protein product [Echinostoma caproni]|uniref:SRP54 domain-containing protein n=1 Tax=Echinostoma caproni TaxID=27848 RepID=A0A183BAC6_9TREM|nr:unnamed protein product [Echinostoma caproni]
MLIFWRLVKHCLFDYITRPYAHKRGTQFFTFPMLHSVPSVFQIAFWLIEKNFRVLIAACDTFRSGAVEQLRTHVHKLNYIHPQGYGRDAASIARSAINYARDRHLDVVLVDTAGRMQDNEPLMRALASLIHLNQPDLVLFVGEALVGNEAVDQLVKFNQSLADHSHASKPRTIDGIVLTKFDTIDDKVSESHSKRFLRLYLR